MIALVDDTLPFVVLLPFAAAVAAVALARAPFSWLPAAVAVVAGTTTCALGARLAWRLYQRGGFAFVDIQGFVGAHIEGAGPWGLPQAALVPSTAIALLAVQLAALLALVLLSAQTRQRSTTSALAAVLVGLGAVSLLAVARSIGTACAGFSLAALAGAWLLVSLEPRRQDVEGAVRVFLLHRVGDVLLLLAVIVAHGALGTTALEEIPRLAPEVEPWRRVVTGAFVGFAPRELWMGTALLVVLASATRLSWGPLLPLARAAAGAPGPAVGFAHGTCFLGAGILLSLKLTPILWLAPEALEVLGWAAAATMPVAALFALAGRDQLRLDVVLLCGFAALAAVCVAAAGLPIALLALVLLVVAAVPLCATSGALQEQTGRADPFTLGGLERRMPRTHTARLLATGALLGPVFSGFVVVAGMLRDVLFAPWLGPAVAAPAVAGAALLAVAAFRPLHLVFTGTEPRERLDPAPKDPPPLLALPPLVAALPLLGLGLLHIPDGVLAALPLDLTYEAPLAAAVLPERALLAPLRAHLLPPTVPPAVGPIAVAAIALAALGLGWLVSMVLYRGGPGRLHRALFSGPRTQQWIGVVAQVAGRESQVARGVGEGATRLSRLIATHLAPGVLDALLRQLPALVGAVLGALVRFAADGSAQRGIAVALLALAGVLLWWGRG